MTQETAAQRLARWVVGLRYEDLTPQAIYHAKRCMLDTLGVQLRGATLPWVQPAYLYARTIGGNGATTISYHGERVHAPYAAYANSVFSYSCELQHHGAAGSAHVGVIVVPVVQALGEQLGASGKDIITAMVAGYEAQGRVGMAISSDEFQDNFKPTGRHFHLQGMVGVFGATAAAGKLLALDAEQQAHAFAIAANHACGLLEYDQAGGEEKRLHGAMGARSGMQAAMLAKVGLTGPLTAFEGRHGYFAAFGGARPKNPDALFNELGNPYCITRCRFRIYSCVGCSHSPIAIIGELMKKHAFHHSEVQSVRVGLYESGVRHVGSIKRPHDVISAQASLAYCVAVRLVKGSNSLEMYLDPALWSDPAIVSIVDQVEAYAVAKPGLPRYTKVEITLKNGKMLAGELDRTPGEEETPFSDEVMADKFRTLTQAVLPHDRVEAIMQAVNSLESLASMSELVLLLQK